MEDFIRWSASGITKRTYKSHKRKAGELKYAVEHIPEERSEQAEELRPRKRVRRIVESDDDDDNECDDLLYAEDDAYTHSSDSTSLSDTPKRKDKTKNLASRLVSAALLSHVNLDPKDTNCDGGTLRLQKSTTSSSKHDHPDIIPRSAARIVDPRIVKRFSFKPNGFDSSRGGTAPTKTDKARFKSFQKPSLPLSDPANPRLDLVAANKSNKSTKEASKTQPTTQSQTSRDLHHTPESPPRSKTVDLPPDNLHEPAPQPSLDVDVLASQSQTTYKSLGLIINQFLSQAQPATQVSSCSINREPVQVPAAVEHRIAVPLKRARPRPRAQISA